MWWSGAMPVWEAGQMWSGAMPVWDAGQMWTGSKPVWEAGQSYGPSAKPVWNAGQMWTGSVPVWYAGCFPKSEMVHTTNDGYAPIGSLKAGDKISSWDSISKKTLYTAVTEIHEYRVSEIVCFNGSMNVSLCHPLLVIEKPENGLVMPKWKVAGDVETGDCVAGHGGRNIIIKSRIKYKFKDKIEVLNLSTDGGLPFIAGGCVVRAENALDAVNWADSPITQKLLAA